MDYRTEGSRGVDERDGVEETGEAETSGMIAPALDEGPMGDVPETPNPDHSGLEEEKGLKAGSDVTHSSIKCITHPKRSFLTPQQQAR